MANIEDLMGSEWYDLLSPFFKENTDLLERVSKEYRDNKGIIYPPFNLIFNAYRLTPFSKVKVIILGQDPYHTPNAAMGLAFSTSNKFVPPSLKNIYKELHNEGITPMKEDGDLVYWAEQGVFLINACLTVRRGIANSHKDIGWDKLIKKTLELLFNRGELVCLCWGNFSKNLVNEISEPRTTNNMLILQSSHPSPYSADKGFFGNNHFIQTNDYLKSIDKEPIQW